MLGDVQASMPGDVRACASIAGDMLCACGIIGEVRACAIMAGEMWLWAIMLGEVRAYVI